MSTPLEPGKEKPCWVTLVTKASYLPGVIILSHTLDKHRSKYPFVVQYTSSLGEDAIAALEAEGKSYGRIMPMKVDLLLPRAGQENIGSVAERFKDTFTKLRAFEVYRLGFTQATFLDADMAAFRNPDEIFNIELPGRDWIAANHCCCCNVDKTGWAPKEWTQHNCPYTSLHGPLEVVPIAKPADCSTYRSLNGGLFVFYPTEDLWTRLLDFFNTTEKLKSYQFPDQDFLADFFFDKWMPVSWKFNAIKTMRYLHADMWSDDELVILHYIVDKPWERQVSDRGVAGHMGRDGVTHQWWWDIYEGWIEEQRKSGEGEVVVKAVARLVGRGEPFTKVVPLPQDPVKLEDAALHVSLPNPN